MNDDEIWEMFPGGWFDLNNVKRANAFSYRNTFLPKGALDELNRAAFEWHDRFTQLCKGKQHDLRE